MKANVFKPVFYFFLMIPVPCASQRAVFVNYNDSTSVPVLEESISDDQAIGLFGNTRRDTSLFLPNSPTNPFDVLITELMPDPSPAISLPENEYVELLNRSGEELNLYSWRFRVGKDVFNFPQVNLPADSFLLITSRGGCAAFSKKSLCLELLPRNCLNNDGEYVGLYNIKNELIHWLYYDKSYYVDEQKDEGGWSIEMIDIDNPCLTGKNWRASVSETGGTPGESNSVAGDAADTQIFQYLHLFLSNDTTVRVYFSKPVGNAKEWMFAIDQGLGSPVKLITDSNRHLYVDLVYRSRFLDIPYNLEFSADICDCAGNPLNAPFSTEFTLPAAVISNDILINEILFDALPGGQEFIELFNHSEKFINSSDIKMGYRPSASEYKKTFEVGDYPILIPPRTFVVLAKDADTFKEFYHLSEASTVLTTKSFPAMNNEEGCVCLRDKDGKTHEEFCYSERLHASLLSNSSGVSLERLRYTLPANDVSNWHSAASAAGFSTPGEVNSQTLNNDPQNEISLLYEIFTPDNDGYKDEVTLDYKLNKTGFMASIIVFDATGRRIRIIANNESLGTHGSLTWNGLDDDGRPAPVGIYLFYIELHHPSGDLKYYRKTCVLGHR
jgi:hypothetical protein